MERYLVQKKLNGKWCNIKSYAKKEDAELVVNLSNDENIRMIDRNNQKENVYDKRTNQSIRGIIGR